MYQIIRCDEEYIPVKRLGYTDDLDYAVSYKTSMSKKGINIGIHLK